VYAKRSKRENFFSQTCILTVVRSFPIASAIGEAPILLNTVEEGDLPRHRHVAQDRDPLGERRVFTEQTRKYLTGGQRRHNE
jgi:hypothetical protein